MAGANWSNVSMLTPGMKNLGNQLNKRFPSRSGRSDGALGDYKHTQSTSGHNPDDTSHHNAEWDNDSDNKSEIRAIDVDSDLNSDVNMQQVVDHLRKLPGLKNVLRYMIYDRKIYRAANNWAPEAYTGPMAHTSHVHFSGAYSNTSDANASFDFKFDELGDNMPTVDEIADGLARHMRDATSDLAVATRAAPWQYKGGGLPVGLSSLNTLNAIHQIVTALGTTVAAESTNPAELQAALANIPQQTAEATVEALANDVPTLADLLKESLTPEALAELIAELNS